METGSIKTGGDYEIKLCLSCDLPDCNPVSKNCPIRRFEDTARREVYLIIKRHPLSFKELQKKTGMTKDGLTRIIKRLKLAKLIKNKDGEWHERKRIAD